MKVRLINGFSESNNPGKGTHLVYTINDDFNAFYTVPVMLSQEHNTSLSKVAEVLLKDWAKGEKDGVILAMEIKAEGGFLSFVRDKPFIHPPFRAQKKAGPRN